MNHLSKTTCMLAWGALAALGCATADDPTTAQGTGGDAAGGSGHMGGAEATGGGTAHGGGDAQGGGTPNGAGGSGGATIPAGDLVITEFMAAPAPPVQPVASHRTLGWGR